MGGRSKRTAKRLRINIPHIGQGLTNLVQQLGQEVKRGKWLLRTIKGRFWAN